MIFRFRRLFLLLFLLTRAAAEEGKLDIKPLAPGVWLHTSWQTVATWGLVPSNGLIVREADHVVVIDTAWGAAPSRALLAWIDRELQLPVTRLIVTHFHDDRLGGWEVFAERGVRIVTSEQTLALAKVAPTPAFDLYRLSPGEKFASGTLEILYPGPAHAPDNVVVWLPASRILTGGCAVRAAASGGLGNLSDASVADWAAFHHPRPSRLPERPPRAPRSRRRRRPRAPRSYEGPRHRRHAPEIRLRTGPAKRVCLRIVMEPADRGIPVLRLDRTPDPTTLRYMTKLADIAAAALRLPDKDRLHLADTLLGSLPPPAYASDPAELLAEARRRDAELDSGQVKPLTEDAFWAGARRARK